MKIGERCLSWTKQFLDWFNARLMFCLNKIEQKSDPQEEFMADTAAKHVGKAHKSAHLIIWVCIVFFMIAITWAAFAMLDEVTAADGKVIPASQIQVIQNLEGGIVKKIFVREGQIVEKGQILMQLDDINFASHYDEAKSKATALQIKIVRLTALVEDKPLVFAPELSAKAPDLVNFEFALYQSQDQERSHLEQAYTLNQKEYNLTKPLVKSGAVSSVEVLRLERQVSDAKGQMDSFMSKVRGELNQAKSDLMASDASLSGFQDRLTRTTIRSPLKGVVKQIKITTIGGVSQPGMDLMEVVPIEDTLLVEAKVRPKDIGFIHLGQDATVKITAYDYSIYGGLPGRVEEISADSINTVSPENPKGESFYLVRVRTYKNFLKTKKNPLYIIPGMVASVDILTGRKSVLDYLLKPILKAKQSALRER